MYQPQTKTFELSIGDWLKLAVVLPVVLLVAAVMWPLAVFFEWITARVK